MTPTACVAPRSSPWAAGFGRYPSRPIDFNYDEGPGHPYNPSVRGVHVENLHVGTTKYVLDMRGYPDDPIHDVTLAHSRFDKGTSPDIVENVDGLVLTDVTVNGSPVGAPVH
jgi:hypothetical protein